VLSDACADAPEPVGVLIAMANFNNFFRSIDSRLSQIRDSITNRLPNIANDFAPAEPIAPPEDLAGTQAGLALTAIGTFGALSPALAPVSSLISVLGAALPVIVGEEDFEEADPDFVSEASRAP
jgi:hypothetical protein